MKFLAPPDWSRALFTIVVLGPVLGFWAQPLSGQTPTPEGTTITNTATVSFTDANTNTYGNVSASVAVTVGFQAGIDLTAGAATVTPAAPSTDNDLTFVVDNDGNGIDQVSVGVAISDGAVVTNVRYLLGATSYPNLAALNAALATTNIAAGGTLTLTVRFNVPTGQGGNPSTVTVTATSVRDGTVSASDNTVVTPALGGTITVTPDGGQNLELLPSNVTQYTAAFSVTSGMTGTDNLDLIASFDIGIVTIVSVNGVAGSTTQLSFTAGQNRTINVVYTVNDVAAGSTDNLRLLARSVSDPTINDGGFFDLTVVRPTITVTKQAWNDAESAQISSDVMPGDVIKYRISVSNTGTADASSISVGDVLPAEVTYDSTFDDGGTPAWVISEAGGTVTGTLTTLGAGATRFFWIRVQIK